MYGSLARRIGLLLFVAVFLSALAVPMAAGPQSPAGGAAAPVSRARHEGVLDTATVGGGGGADYATLKDAFDAINAGTLTGDIVLDVIGDTTETTMATLNASGSGSASYTSVLIQPSGGAARTISGAIAGNALLTLNGADNVTIDGLNTGGDALTLSNTSTSSTSGTSTLKFITDATNNLITNASILGSSTTAATTNGGNIWFAAGAIATGNDNNTISDCNIGPAGTNLPSKAVYGNGTTTNSTLYNSGIQIASNSIYDYFHPTAASYGIYLSGGNTAWTISDNRFYQTGTRTQTTGAIHAAIQVAGSQGNDGHTVSGNIIGYASAAGTGTYNLVGAGTGSKFLAIYFSSASTATPSSIQGNTITAIDVSGVVGGTGATSAFAGISVSSGVANIGDATGNTIGSLTAAGAISVASTSASALEVVGIVYTSFSSTYISNNSVGGITATNAGTGALTFYGIRVNTDTGHSNTIMNNAIGGTAADSIANNAVSVSSRVIGIQTDYSTPAITGNTVRNMTMAAGNTGTGATAAVIGIAQNATATAGATVSQNIVHSLSNTHGTAAVTVIGLRYNGPSGSTNVVAGNFIHSLSASSTDPAATIAGIQAAGGETTYQNNMVGLGLDEDAADLTAGIAINGIEETAGTNNFYFNSVYVGGNGVDTGTGNTYAFTSIVTVNARALQDNVFFNARSNAGTGGTHYAVRAGGTGLNPTGLTIDYNMYYVDGTGGVLGYYDGLDVVSLIAWQAAVGQDGNSLFADPSYNNPTGSSADLSLHLGNNPTPAEQAGLAIASVTDDIDGEVRADLTPADIGADAWDFTPVDLSVPVISYPAPGNGAPLAGREFGDVTITDASGVDTAPGTGPRVYFKRSTDANAWNDNTSGTDGWKYVEANGTTSPFDFTLDYSLLYGGTGVSAGDTVQYFVVAQDLAGTPNVGINSGAFGAVPASVDLTAAAFPVAGTIKSYTIVESLSGTVTVCTSGCDYPSLTVAGGLFEAINGTVVTGDVTALIQSDLVTETGAVSLNEFLEDEGSGFTITIQPDGDQPRTVSGNVAGALINLNGADRVVFDGLNDGGNTLLISNASTAASAVVIRFIADASDNALRNLEITGGSTNSVGGLVLFSTGTTTGNDDNVIDLCTVHSDGSSIPRYLVYSLGSSPSVANSDNLILDSQLFDFSTTGIYIAATGNETWTIVGSSVYESAERNTSLTGIHFSSRGSGRVAGNTVHDLITSGTTSATGIRLDDARNVVVSNNRVYGFSGTSGATGPLTGIYYNGQSGTTDPVTIVNNQISIAPEDTDQTIYGIRTWGYAGNTAYFYANSAYVGGFAAIGGTTYACDSTADSDTTFIGNICFNARTGGAANYAMANEPGDGTFSADYNLYGGTGASEENFMKWNVAETDFGGWQSSSGQDANSLADTAENWGTSLGFTDPDGGDLHIDAASPARGASTPIAEADVDYDNQARNTTAPDIGADEYYEEATCPMSGTYTDDTYFTDNPCHAEGDTIAEGDLQTAGDLVIDLDVTVTLGTHELFVNDTLTSEGRVEQTRTVNGSEDVPFVSTGNYGGVTINANDVDLDTTTVIIRDIPAGESCTSTGFISVGRCFKINATNATGRDATVRFYFDAATDLNGLTCDELRAYHLGAGGWELAGDLGGTPVCTSGLSYVEVTGVTDFSDFLVAAEQPTAIVFRGGAVTAGSAPAWPVLALVIVLATGLVLRRRSAHRVSG